MTSAQLNLHPQITTFAQLDLHPQIFKAISACGYTQPTPIQARSIIDILNGMDVVASAQTGTGKTAAFVLPALHRLSTTKATQKPRILILTPTRELATQITKAAEKYGKFLRFNIVSLVGGMPYHQQLRKLSRPVDIIVATPGRLMDHMRSRRLDLSAIEMLILDEADRMLDMGFIDDVEFIANSTPKSRQTLLFSATVDSKLATVVRHLLKNPTRIDLSSEKLSPAKIKQELYIADNIQHKNRLLQHLLDNENMFKAIIFSATKINADKLAKQLSDQGFPAAALHGDLKQSARNRTVEQLRSGKIQFLVATDVAARGIDINDITHVINFDLPKFSEDYVHRIGRTGRAGKSGIAISLAMPGDAKHVQRIERFTKQKFVPLTIPGLEPKTKNLSSGNDNPNDSSKRHKNKSYGKKSNKNFRSDKKSSDDFRSGKKTRRFRSDRKSDDNFKPDRKAGSSFRSDRKSDDNFKSDKKAGSNLDQTENLMIISDLTKKRVAALDQTENRMIISNLAEKLAVALDQTENQMIISNLTEKLVVLLEQTENLMIISGLTEKPVVI